MTHSKWKNFSKLVRVYFPRYGGSPQTASRRLCLLAVRQNSSHALIRMIPFVICLNLLLNLFVIPAVFADQDELHKGVDRRYRFSKSMQSEISLYGGNYLGDETHNSWDAGAKYYLHLNNTFAIGAAYLYTPIYADMSSTFGRSIRSHHQHIMDAEVMIANDCAFRVGKDIVECDLYFTIGAGTMWINRHYEMLGMIGGGLKIYTFLPWLAVRFDVNSYIHPTPNPTGDTINADIAMNAGVSFLFPTKKTQNSKLQESSD